jgi:hypothetical protein
MRHVGALALVVLLATATACGGGVADGASSSGAGASSSGSSSGSGSCTPLAVDATRACVPGTATANQAITVGIDDTTGCLECFANVEGCTVSVAANKITLSMKGRQCTPPGEKACPAICAIPSSRCTIPPLEPGKYAVEVVGEGSRAGLPPRELVVTASAQETSCELLRPGTSVPELDRTKYSASCSVDADCMLATFGNACQRCACPSAAIAVTEAERYEADRRASLSQCAGDKQPISCAACPPVKAHCDVNGNELTGTCKLEPGF